VFETFPDSAAALSLDPSFGNRGDIRLTQVYESWLNAPASSMTNKFPLSKGGDLREVVISVDLAFQ
jgi:hypothetical protein